MNNPNQSLIDWRPPIDKWYNVEIDAYELVFEQAKIRFEDVLAESESITEKSLKMLGWVGALMAFYVGILIKAKASNLAFLFPLLILLAEIIVLLLLIMPKNIRNRGISPDQSIPQNLDIEEPLNQVKLVYYSHIIILRDNITVMLNKNRSRSTLYLLAQIGLVLLLAAISTEVSILFWGAFR